MHEISVLQQVINTCRDVAKENDVENIKVVTLNVGELTGYLPVFFYEYFPIITKDEKLFEDTELKIILTKGEGLCSDCGAMYNIMAREGKCPKCGSRNKKIIGGQAFTLEEIVV